MFYREREGEYPPLQVSHWKQLSGTVSNVCGFINHIKGKNSSAVSHTLLLLFRDFPPSKSDANSQGTLISKGGAYCLG